VISRRNLAMPERAPVDSAELARVTADDVTHARETARTVCTAIYRRFLAATLDDRERIPTGE
jgi:hypothetical protein